MLKWLTIVMLALVVIFVSIGSVSFGQVISNGPEIVHNVKRAIVSIESLRSSDYEKAVEPTKLGSGILVVKNGRNYAVTNYHVIKGVFSQDRLLVGMNLETGKTHNVINIAVRDSAKDIAVLLLTDEYRVKDSSDDSEGVNLDQITLGISRFGDSSSIQEGQNIITIGFPLGIGTEITRNRPVVRGGIIGQSLRSDGTFLIDGVVSHGNSGSPVFSLRDGKLLGIVKAFQYDFISALDERGQVLAKLPINSGLSVCIGSSEIWKTIP